MEDHTVSILLIHLRKRLKINNIDTIYLFTEDKSIPCPSYNILQLYNEYKNDDGYLYFDVKKENTFGV